MASSSSGGVFDHPAGAATSTLSQTAKRDQASAELSNRNPRPKRQAIEVKKSPMDLKDVILIGYDSKNRQCQAPLTMFLDRSVGNNILPTDYKYNEFRAWTEEVLDVQADKELYTIVTTGNGEEIHERISPNGEFGAVLQKVEKGVFGVFSGGTIEFGLLVLAEPTYSTPEALPAEEAPESANVSSPMNDEVALQQPVTEKPAESSQSTEKVLETNFMDLTIDEPTPEEPSRINCAESEKNDSSSPPRVLTGKEFFDLLRKAAGPEDPILAAAVPDEPDADKRFFKPDPRTFSAALVFFNTHLGEKGCCPLPALGKTAFAFWWQIYVVYEMLFAPIRKGLSGFIIGLDVGFGKTILTLLYILARAELIGQQRERKKQYKGKCKDEQNPKHLPSDNHDPTKKCPSEHERITQCPCVFNSDARKLLPYMRDIPALIMIPPSLKGTWAKEAKGFYYQKDLKSGKMRFYGYFGEATDAVNDISRSAWNKDAELVEQHIEDTEGKYDEDLNFVTRHTGTANDVFLVSDKVMSSLVDLYIKEGLIKENTLFHVGVIFMDEFHNYKGTIQEDTIPFKMSFLIAKLASDPVSLFALCATAVEEGPIAWRALTQYYLDQWQRFGKGKEPKLFVKAPFTNPEDFLTQNHTVRKAHVALLREIMSGSANEDSINTKIDMIRSRVAPFLVSARQSQRWRGETLNKIPKVYITDTALCDTDASIAANLDEKTRDARNKQENSIQTLLKAKLSLEKQKWLKNKENFEKDGMIYQEPEPTMAEVVQDDLGADKARNNYAEFARVSTFPYLAVLQGTLPPETFKSEDCQKTVVRYQKGLWDGKDRAKLVEDCFDQWDFTKHSEELQKNSPKFKHLLKLMDNLASHEAELPENAIIWANHSITACVIFFLVESNEELRERIEPLLFTSKVSNDMRQKLVDHINTPRKKGRRSKVLIAVTDVAAEGFNIQGANHVWFSELPITATKVHQAVGRTARTKQKLEVKVVRMYDDSNFLDKTIFQAVGTKLRVAERLYNVETG